MIQLPRAGGCPDRPVHLIASIDSSASVLGGADPIGMRLTEVQVALERVGSKCKCGEELVSILHFDHPVHNDLVSAKLTDSKAIAASLTIPLDGRGCSLLGPSLQAARRLTVAYPDHRSVLIALTDFELFDASNVWDEFASFPGDVHACILGGRFHGFDDDPRVNAIRIDRTNQPGVVAAAVFSALATGRAAPRRGRSAPEPVSSDSRN